MIPSSLRPSSCPCALEAYKASSLPLNESSPPSTWLHQTSSFLANQKFSISIPHITHLDYTHTHTLSGHESCLHHHVPPPAHPGRLFLPQHSSLSPLHRHTHPILPSTPPRPSNRQRHPNLLHLNQDQLRSKVKIQLYTRLRSPHRPFNRYTILREDG